MGWIESEVYGVIVDTPDELLAPLLDPAARKKRKLKINSEEEQHAIFAHKLQGALRLTVGFSKVYCEL